MLGYTSGFATLVKNEAPHDIVTHFLFTQTRTGNKDTSNNPERNFANGIKVNNFITSRSLNDSNLKTFAKKNTSLPPDFRLVYFSAYSTLKMGRCVPPKRRLTFNGLHDIISQKILFFITTAVRTSNPAYVKQRRGILIFWLILRFT
jgi:hypothetical protein